MDTDVRPLALPAIAGAPFDGHALVVHETLESARADWRNALTQGAAFVFQTWEWNEAWQRTVGDRQGVRPRIVALRDPAGETVALWPLGIYRRQRIRVLDFLGEVMSDYRAPIVRPAFIAALPAGAFEALWRAIAKGLRGVDLVQMRRMPAVLDLPADRAQRLAVDADLLTMPNPMVSLPGAEHTENAHAARLPDALEAFDKRFSARRLSDMRRRIHQLSHLDMLAIIMEHPPHERPPIIDVMAEQKSQRWRATGSRDLFAEPGYLDFYRELEFDADTPACVSLSSMRVGPTYVATHWGVSFRQRYYWLLPTYDATGEWSKHSCGRAMLHAVVGWAIKERFAVFDLTVGDEAYKLDWADHTMALYTLSQPVTVRGQAMVRLQQAKAWARQQGWLRRLLGKDRGKGKDDGKGKAPAPAVTPADASG